MVVALSEYAIPLAGVAVAVFGVLFTRMRKDEYAGVNLPPGDLGLPFIGNALEFSRCVKTFAAVRPPISSISLLGVRAVSIGDPVAAEKIIRGEGILIEPNEREFKPANGMLGEHAITAVQGAYHKRVRSQLLPAFSATVLDRVFMGVQPMISRHVDTWLNRGEFDGSEVPRHIAAEFACAFIGIDVNKDPSMSMRFMSLIDHMLEAAVSVPVNIPGIPTAYRKGYLAREEIFEKHIRPIIKQRREHPLNEDLAKHDLVSLILKAKDTDGKIMCEQAIEENMLVMVTAAVDTTSTTMMNFLRYMCKFPRYQELIRSEIHTVLDDDATVVTTEDLDEMTYLEQVMREIMRVATVLPLLYFAKAKKTFEVGGYTIPKGMNIQLQAYELSHNPTIFKNPDTFDPSRFAEGGEGLKHNRILLGFGFGTGMCLGKRVANRIRKLFAVKLLKDHRIEFADQHEPTMSAYLPFQQVVGKFPVKLTRVTHCSPS